MSSTRSNYHRLRRDVGRLLGDDSSGSSFKVPDQLKPYLPYIGIIVAVLFCLWFFTPSWVMKKKRNGMKVIDYNKLFKYGLFLGAALCVGYYYYIKVE